MSAAYAFSVAIRTLVVAVFAVSFASKVRGWNSYASWLARLPVPLASHRGLPATLAASELLAGLLTAFTPTAAAGLAAASVLCVLLLAGVLAAVRGGTNEPCLCFGASAAPMGYQHVVRNALLTALAIAGLITALLARGTAAGSLLGPVIGGLAGATLIIFAEDLVALLRPTTPRTSPGSH